MKWTREKYANHMNPKKKNDKITESCVCTVASWSYTNCWQNFCNQNEQNESMKKKKRTNNSWTFREWQKGESVARHTETEWGDKTSDWKNLFDDIFFSFLAIKFHSLSRVSLLWSMQFNNTTIRRKNNKNCHIFVWPTFERVFSCKLTHSANGHRSDESKRLRNGLARLRLVRWL